MDNLTENKLEMVKATPLSLVLICLLLLGCKKYEQPELTPLNQDCSCASEVNADFEILELEGPFGLNPQGTDTDTIYMGKNVIFRAKEEGAEYTWYIGNEILDTKEVGRYFSSAYADQEMTVSLVVRKQANTICFPNDDGYDSISKRFYVQNYETSDLTSAYDNGVTLMEGVYRVKSPTMADSIDITIDYIDRTPPPSPVDQIDITNFDGQGTTVWIPRGQSTLKNYRAFWVPDQGISKKCIQGKFLYNMSGESVFDISFCELINGEYVMQEHQMKGRKL